MMFPELISTCHFLDRCVFSREKHYWRKIYAHCSWRNINHIHSKLLWCWSPSGYLLPECT